MREMITEMNQNQEPQETSRPQTSNVQETLRPQRSNVQETFRPQRNDIQETFCPQRSDVQPESGRKRCKIKSAGCNVRAPMLNPKLPSLGPYGKLVKMPEKQPIQKKHEYTLSVPTECDLDNEEVLRR